MKVREDHFREGLVRPRGRGPAWGGATSLALGSWSRFSKVRACRTCQSFQCMAVPSVLDSGETVVSLEALY